MENVDKILLKLEPAPVTDLIVPWRRRSRIRKVLHKLRSIRRTNPHLHLEYLRTDTDIYVILPTEGARFLFELTWPENLPQWQTVSQ